MSNVEERLDRIERAVFASKDDWPTGHDSLQSQLDELYKSYGDLKLAFQTLATGFTCVSRDTLQDLYGIEPSSPDAAPSTDVTRVSVIVHGDYGKGLEYESYHLQDVELSYQDDGRTLKVCAKRNIDAAPTTAEKELNND